ncbi:MAG: nucleoid occlusion factor SlmA [Betaproteobacteria bacterium]|nr:nucleoid occlusion factor SlmA [Betaproteobacteria bacterium]MDE1981467.1 nucleoid occlusion factor SlmA [Betaproteobacteria bacterium]MDE2625093.1 nucleoid occlusion factor SlmA [Betaproteobacteria bacterium]
MKPGERRNEILQTLAAMLEEPQAEKTTTANLARRLELSEAALYRHFASKAQMFEGLIAFIEETLFTRINRILDERADGLAQVESVLALLLAFSDKNPGMTRVLIGDALVNENERLQSRINQLHDRLEATLRQSLRLAASGGGLDPAVNPGTCANVLLCYVIGRWHQFAKSGFKRSPLAEWEQQWALLRP